MRSNAGVECKSHCLNAIWLVTDESSKSCSHQFCQTEREQFSRIPESVNIEKWHFSVLLNQMVIVNTDSDQLNF